MHQLQSSKHGLPSYAYVGYSHVNIRNQQMHTSVEDFTVWLDFHANDILHFIQSLFMGHNVQFYCIGLGRFIVKSFDKSQHFFQKTRVVGPSILD